MYRSHSESVYVETEETITPDEARALMEAEKGIIVQDDPQNNVYPMPLFTSDTDEVYVGRIRRDLGCDKALKFVDCPLTSCAKVLLPMRCRLQKNYCVRI